MENKELVSIVEKHKQMMDTFENNMKKLCDEFKVEMTKLFEQEDKFNGSK